MSQDSIGIRGVDEREQAYSPRQQSRAILQHLPRSARTSKQRSEMRGGLRRRGWVRGERGTEEELRQLSCHATKGLWGNIQVYTGIFLRVFRGRGTLFTGQFALKGGGAWNRRMTTGSELLYPMHSSSTRPSQ